MLGNLLRATLCLSVAGLIGYYNFGVNGWIGVATNAAFFAMGFLLVSTWRHPEKSKSEAHLEAQSSRETNSPVFVVERPVEIAKKKDEEPVEMIATMKSNLTPTTSPTEPSCPTAAM